MSTIDAVLDRFQKQLSDEGITRTRYLDLKELATQVGMRETYDIVNKVCSKFVHPTAWSLLTADAGSKRFPEAQYVFYECGAEYFETIIAEIIPHIRQWGLRRSQE